MSQTIPPGAETALRRAQITALTVAAYRRFLDEHGIDIRELDTVHDLRVLPVTTKNNYRHQYSLRDVLAGTVQDIDTISWSAGTSGRATEWPRDATTVEHCAHMFGAVLHDLAETELRPALVIIAFPLGSYVGGTLVYSAMRVLRRRGHLVTMTTPGMDIAALEQAVAVAGGLFERIVILLYPPVVRDLLDRCGRELARFDVTIVVGGEPVSEAWRRLVHTMLADPEGDRVRVIYGATDVWFVGYETASSIAIRSAAADDSGLNAALFGDTYCGVDVAQQPAFVRYFPESTFIETDADSNLVFTVGGIVPLIRYRVKDRGEVVTGADIRACLRRAGREELIGSIVDDDAYVIVYGRTDVAAIFNAVNIYPDFMRPAVEHISLATRLTGRFALRVRTDDAQRQYLELDAELRAHSSPGADTAEHLKQLTIASMRQHSAEYRVVHDQRGVDAEPVVELLPFQSPVFATERKQRTVQ